MPNSSTKAYGIGLKAYSFFLQRVTVLLVKLDLLKV